jgi:hypothetical protein
MDLFHFIERYRAPLTKAVNRTYPPRDTAALAPALGFDLALLGRRLLGAQAHAIVGEMGTGKSYCGAAAAFISGARGFSCCVRRIWISFRYCG